MRALTVPFFSMVMPKQATQETRFDALQGCGASKQTPKPWGFFTRSLVFLSFLGGLVISLGVAEVVAQTTQPTQKKGFPSSRPTEGALPQTSQATKVATGTKTQRATKVAEGAMTQRATRGRRHSRRRAPLDPALVRQGEALYRQQCAACHHEARQGRTGSPLLPIFLRRYSDAALERILLKGKPATQMPAFPSLQPKERHALIAYMRSPARVPWSRKAIKETLILSDAPKQHLPIKRYDQVTAVVERGKDSVWLMEGERVLTRFPVKNVHGGIKFASDRKQFFVPSRDGWITRFAMDEGRWERRIRACIYLRNLALVEQGRYLVAACWLPRQLVILEASSLRVVKHLPLDGQISAIYTQRGGKEAIFTLQDRPMLGRLQTASLTISWQPLPVALSDFFLDPFDRFLIGTTRRGDILYVYDLEKKKIVFSEKLPGMPHLFSAAFWYEGGRFFFATAHMRLPILSVWEMYRWRLIRHIQIGGQGIFVRTHPKTPYLWADNQTDALLLIDKKTFAIQKKQPIAGKQVMHTEFSGEGDLAYVSVFSPDGALLLFDPITLEKKASLPASWPVGKYNTLNKSRRSLAIQWGSEVFLSRCWGCHHTTETAFAPSFREIAKKRHPSWIRAQMLDPALTAKHLGYKRSAMPKIPLNSEEIEALISFLLDQKR